jgi:hypothetical protein
MNLLLSEPSQNGQIVVEVQILKHGGFRKVIMETDVEPLFACFRVFILRPLSFDFATFPCEDKDDTWHFKLERVVFFEFHSEDLCFS